MKSNRFLNITITDTVKRLTLWNVVIFLIILAAFNVAIISIVNFILMDNIDIRIQHEMENILDSFEVKGDSITIVNYREFNERDLREITDNPYFVQIYDNKNNILITSDNISLFEPIPFSYNYDLSEFTFIDTKIGRDRMRVGYAPVINDTGQMIANMQVAVFEKEFDSLISKVILFNIILFPFVILVVVMASIFLAKKTFNPLNKIIDTANRITASNLGTRIKYNAEPDDELGKLRDTLNALFTRLESYFTQVSQFTDHASHQLMNPLTAIITELDYLLKKDRPSSEYREALAGLKEQTERMIRIIRSLLILSKEENFSDNELKVYNLSRLINDEVRKIFEDKPVVFHVNDDAYVKGDSQRFLLAAENIIDNALKYTSDDSEVIVSVVKNERYVNISVLDKGMGVPDAEKEQIFERFYRSSQASELGIKGHGLGLSLVKSIVLQAGGTITVKDNKPRGTIFTISLPLVIAD